MPESATTGPVGVSDTAGIVHRRSPFSVADTIEQLTTAIEGAGARLFVVVDHSGEAERAGLLLRDTKLLIFGSPAAGTPVMQVAPLAALDLPLKVLVWADDEGAVWMSYLSSDWLAKRHDLPGELSTRLKAAEVLTGRVEASS